MPSIPETDMKLREELVLPFKGYTDKRTPTTHVDRMADEDLQELNRLLNWQCFTVDSHGRRFGNVAWRGKRSVPQTVPDRRIVMLHEKWDLSNKTVLEVGCFEGLHTVGLCQFAQRVTAVDSRVDNVVKTVVRSAFFGYNPHVFPCNIEAQPLPVELLQADVLHHVGVLYHLQDPIRHLQALGKYIRYGVMLDTHYCLESQVTDTDEVDGKTYRYKRYGEFGKKDPFSGMYDHSKWLLLEDIVSLLQGTGFESVEIVETRDERNGPRVLLLARREA